ncbi:MAG TPA: hypothetical protein VIM50_00915 [Candidatus Limnocylindria bacterium]
MHAHLATAHADRVVTTAKEGSALLLRYEVRCPHCDFTAQRIVNPRGRDPDFLEEFAAEIRLVAFDQLLYHLEAAHSQPADLPAEG